MDKRYISIGFKEPKSLERDIIHIWLEKPGSVESIKANAISTVEFNYPVCAISGNILRETTKNATNVFGWSGNCYAYQKFIREIVERNNGYVDYSELIEQGANVFRAMREQIK